MSAAGEEPRLGLLLEEDFGPDLSRLRSRGATRLYASMIDRPSSLTLHKAGQGRDRSGVQMNALAILITTSRILKNVSS